MAERLDEPEDLRGPESLPLPEREWAVLAEIGREQEATVAFQGLRRRLELHQESLTRALRRLERNGLVARDPKGYRVTDQGLVILEGRRPVPAGSHTQPLVEAALPPELSPQTVVNHLSRRWFRGLRWYGQSGGPEETVLTWTADVEPLQVRVRISGGTVRIEVEGSAGAQSYAAARGVFAALAELYGLMPDPPAGAAAGSVFSRQYAA